jgi:pyruvate formate lyase activating enzyme
MVKGLIFDIRELTIHDGPGVRTTVFMKGCPLECSWCHNPEGQSAKVQNLKSAAGERVVGRWYSPEELASYLNKQAHLLKTMNGGITFSGGEPLMQSEFVLQVIEKLKGIHIVLDTSGCGDTDDFTALIERCQLVLYDLKIIDDELHQKYTKSSNSKIHENLFVLSDSGTPFYIRIPLIPGITDTRDNLSEAARLVRELPGLLGVDLLPYNKLAPGKYPTLGIPYQPYFDGSKAVIIMDHIFQQAGIKVRTL